MGIITSDKQGVIVKEFARKHIEEIYEIGMDIRKAESRKPVTLLVTNGKWKIDALACFHQSEQTVFFLAFHAATLLVFQTVLLT